MVTKVATFERHAVSVMVFVVTGLLGFIGYTTWQTSVGVAELRVEVRALSVSTIRLENRFDDHIDHQ